jgi:aminoglycoside phosphotransferase family enzyme/predicted kinase
MRPCRIPFAEILGGPVKNFTFSAEIYVLIERVAFQRLRTAMTLKNSAPLIQALLSPSVYSHPVEKIELVETHISWVILTGHYTYKIKKPINLGFVDFSTLEKRNYYCQEELRLNRRLAPDLYLDLIRITGSVHKPVLNGSGPAIEYGVRMKQFDRTQELDKVLDRGELLRSHLDPLARELAEFHRQAEKAPGESPFGTPDMLAVPMRENFSQIRSLAAEPEEEQQLDWLEAWTETSLKEHREDFLNRKKEGFVRECHGDLHLANMVLVNDHVTIFDTLEFNENLRFIDVMSDLAFLLMDLDDRGHPELANRFLNRYLRESGDYPGLKLLRLYKVYRAMVRAKVASIRLGQPDLQPGEAKLLRKEHWSYITLAEKYTRPAKNALFMTAGFSGAGKSVLAGEISEISGAVWIRTDVERKRMAATSASGKTGSPVEGGIYTEEMTRRLYERIGRLALILLKEGYSVILDGTFLRRAQREMILELAQKIAIPSLILHCTLPETLLQKRVIQRREEGVDPSEADLKVLQWQMRTFEAFSKDELSHLLTLDAATPFDMPNIISRISSKLNISWEKKVLRGL